MKFRRRTVEGLAELICGNSAEDEVYFFPYRSSYYLTAFFKDAGTLFEHDGSTRSWWVADTLKAILAEPSKDAQTPPDAFLRVIQCLMDQGDAENEPPARPGALEALNAHLAREGYEAFYGKDRRCYLRNTDTNAIAGVSSSPHRPLSPEETQKKEALTAFLDKCSEDELIKDVLMPLFRQLGFSRITAAGHKDKALEYGKDIWMRHVLPTQHVLYFGIQAKRGKLDSAGVTKSSNANVAEIHNQVTMMLGHEVFDPEVSRRVLVDHVFIIAGGEITKAARNWIGNKLDATKRSQIMFMDRDDIINLFVTSNVPLPAKPGDPATPFDEEIPF
ncbi:hypothetical protein [Yoonia sp. R2-816]|uniref:hypothetical protein n=1 Tax=Yoonia sp. R2-816 TaxID=3342638 RepID=UPI00372A4DD7